MQLCSSVTLAISIHRFYILFLDFIYDNEPITRRNVTLSGVIITQSVIGLEIPTNQKVTCLFVGQIMSLDFRLDFQ